MWVGKIQYSISIPSKAIAFGSYVQVDFKLIPLLKGLAIGNISTQVREEQEFVLDPDLGVIALGGGISKNDRVISQDNFNVDQQTTMQIIDEVTEGFQFSRFLELPKTLNSCLQDCNIKGIKIRHKVKFNVQLLNPDGHISELRANLPVSLYISPNLPINEDNVLVDQSPQASRAAVENDLTHSAPPLYGEHMLDKLYSEVDPSGYLTPGLALSTPGTPYLHSRQPSHDNLRSLNAMATSNSGGHTPNRASSINPAVLQYRLQNLHVSGEPSQRNDQPEVQVHPASTEQSRRNSDPNTGNDYFVSHDGTGSQSRGVSHNNPDQTGAWAIGSDPVSRRASEEEDGYQSGARTPFPQYAHMEDLSRVPSYSTAVKTNAPRRLSRGTATDLPTYGDTVTGSGQAVLAEPPTAHIQSSSRSRNASLADDTQAGLPSSLPHRHVSALQDDERRLRLMQLRGR